MHYLFALALPVALAAKEIQPDQYDWSIKPYKTAEWYKKYGLTTPGSAPERLFGHDSFGESFILKLECLGCPFRVREKYQVEETWQEPPQANFLMLNFTSSNSSPLILLNGFPIMPLESRPPAITAFQIPANSSYEIMYKMVEMHMLDHETWNLGTKYGHFELQYEHTLVATRTPGVELLQFDVTGIHMRGDHNPGNYNLRQEGQKMVQILFGRGSIKEKQVLIIYGFQVLERKDKPRPFKMPCGKVAMIKTEYNPLGWDYFGKLGTWTRTWDKFIWDTTHVFDRIGRIIGIVLILLAITRVCWRIKCSRDNAVAIHLKEDAEAAKPRFLASIVTLLRTTLTFLRSRG